MLNPRARNKKVFAELVTSIANLGLKKPITVSARKDKSGFDLVCGQGRLEAFIALEQLEIPAIVIEAAVEDCFVMSLVENLARRHHTPLEFIREIASMRERGYSNSDIARKTDFSEEPSPKHLAACRYYRNKASNSVDTPQNQCAFVPGHNFSRV